ncbi:MAG: hypothetical protein ABI162_08180 [Luteolibacter sp.]
MKNRAHWLIIPAVAVSLGACNKKEEAKAPAAPAPAGEAAKPEAAPAAPVVPKVVALTAAERAAKLGFAKNLPQDTEFVLSFYNGSKTADRVKSSKLWKLVEKEMAGGAGMDDPDLDLDDDAAESKDKDAEKPAKADDADEQAGPAMLFGTEFTMAVGKSAGEQAANLMTAARRMSYFQMRGIAKAFVAAAKKGNAADVEKSLAHEMGGDLALELLKDPESGVKLLERAKMPPLYLAFRVKEAQLPSAAQQVSAMIANAGMLGPMVEAVEVEKAGHKFAGFKISGAKISETMAAERKSMEESLDPAMVDQLLAIVAKKDLVILSGTVGDYVTFFMGSSVDDLNLASGVDQSLVASDALAFSDAYASKDLAALVYGQKAGLDTIMASIGGLSNSTNGLRDGIAGADGIGETRDLETLFQMVADREAALRKLTRNDALGTVAFFEEGLKIESFGGTDQGAFDWKAANKLSHLGDSSDVVLFADATVDAGYDEKANAYLESLVETAYAITMKVTEIPVENEDVTKFKEMAKLFDGKFRTDMIALWDARDQLHDSLGHERALVVDLKGSAPAVPGIPQAVVDKAKVPRISLVAPVTDRVKLSASWDKMNATTTGILGKVSEMVGKDIPMQKPLSSEKNGLVTWFFPMPFFNEDFLPSVTVGDQWFAASTSKNQALDLISQATAGGETRDGLWFSMNFKALQTYAEETYRIVDENAEAITGAPFTPEQKKHAKDAIKTLSDLDKLTVHSRREGAVLRSSIHFKTR